MAGKSDALLRRFACAALLVAAGPLTTSAEPVHGRSSELGIEFALAGGSDWCKPDVTVRLAAANAAVYQAEAEPFRKMIGRIRAVIHHQCSTVERIVFIGHADQQKVFATEMSKLTRWRRFVPLDPVTGKPSCAPSANDPSACDKLLAAYTSVTTLMRGPAFAGIEVTSLMEDRDDLHAAWQAQGAFGALQLSRRSDYQGRYADHTAFAEANIAVIAESCTGDGGQVSQVPGADYGAALAYRSALCRLPGKPSRLNIVLVTIQGDWFYLFSLWGEEPNMAPANTMATRLAEALTAPR